MAAAVAVPEGPKHSSWQGSSCEGQQLPSCLWRPVVRKAAGFFIRPILLWGFGLSSWELAWSLVPGPCQQFWDFWVGFEKTFLFFLVSQSYHCWLQLWTLVNISYPGGNSRRLWDGISTQMLMPEGCFRAHFSLGGEGHFMEMMGIGKQPLTSVSLPLLQAGYNKAHEETWVT